MAKNKRTSNSAVRTRSQVKSSQNQSNNKITKRKSNPSQMSGNANKINKVNKNQSETRASMDAKHKIKKNKNNHAGISNKVIQSRAAQKRKNKHFNRTMKTLNANLIKNLCKHGKVENKESSDMNKTPIVNDEIVYRRFHEDRNVSFALSPVGKSIQVTCKNNIAKEENTDVNQVSDIVDTPTSSWYEKSTVLLESPKTSRTQNDDETIPMDTLEHVNENDSQGHTAVNNRLSLTTQCKLFLQDLQAANLDKLQLDRIQENNDKPHESEDQNTQSLFNENQDDEVICISDTTIAESVITIDDDSTSNEKNPAMNTHTEKIEVIDLTTPSKRTKKRAVEQVIPPVPTVHPNLNLFFPTLSPQFNAIPGHRLSLDYNHQSNIYGNNFLNVGSIRTVGLRPIFIDGNNIAMLHSNGKFFSVRGLKICIDYFKIRGHDVTAIVPQIRKKRNQSSDPAMLFKLEKEGSVIFTPSRVINGRNIIPYDDRFIVQLAAVHQGIIVSCDNYTDLLRENPNLRETIENRVLNPTFVKDMLIFPSDPLGRYGPKLDELLMFPIH